MQDRSVADLPGELARRVVREERLLLTSVGAWGALGVVAGTAMWVAGRGRSARILVGIGRQAALWGSVDLAVAGFGARRSPPAPDSDGQARRRARRMAAITGANAVADVAYLAVAARLLRSPRRSPDALGAVVQAAFLLVVDARHAGRFVRLGRSGRSASRSTRP